jgi:hypothetical protein
VEEVLAKGTSAVAHQARSTAGGLAEKAVTRILQVALRMLRAEVALVDT